MYDSHTWVKWTTSWYELSFPSRLGFKSGYGLNIAVVGVGGMDGCSLAEGGAGGKEGAGSFWDMTFSASMIVFSGFAKESSALLSKPAISFSKYSRQ